MKFEKTDVHVDQETLRKWAGDIDDIVQIIASILEIDPPNKAQLLELGFNHLKSIGGEMRGLT